MGEKKTKKLKKKNEKWKRIKKELMYYSEILRTKLESLKEGESLSEKELMELIEKATIGFDKKSIKDIKKSLKKALKRVD